MIFRILTVCVLILPGLAVADDWVTDWIDDSMTGSGPSYYEGATRGYFSAGNLSLRSRVSSERPLTISPPRLKMGGCGGIDMFMGGISYMDLDMLVEKFELMIQNGEVIAFQIAIKALSEKLGTTVEQVEAILNKINGIQLDSCSMAKSAVTTVVEAFDSENPSVQDAMGNIYEEVSQQQDMLADEYKNTWERARELAAQNQQPSSSTRISDEISACPTEIKRALTVEGSVLGSLAGDYGLSDYSEVIRGYMGDMLLYHSEEGGIPVATMIPPCPQNSLGSADDFVLGRYYVLDEITLEDTTRECRLNEDANLVGIIELHLDNLATALTDSESSIEDYDNLEDFLTTAPLPVYSIMQFAVNAGVQDYVIEELKVLLAYSYSYQIFDDLYSNTSSMLRELSYALSTNAYDSDEADDSGVDSPRCNLRPYTHVIANYNLFGNSLKDQHAAVKEQYSVQLQMVANTMRIVKRYEDQKRALELKVIGGQ